MLFSSSNLMSDDTEFDTEVQFMHTMLPSTPRTEHTPPSAPPPLVQVRTPVPFLLRHKLRDYQHIGLDWLVMMHERKLNGILADEMGLGKTIQTIALLAHVACEQGVWGPHLIVVPTSVLLNWEFEFKKWCPAFKILTYFGSTKERKQLRVVSGLLSSACTSAHTLSIVLQCQ